MWNLRSLLIYTYFSLKIMYTYKIKNSPTVFVVSFSIYKLTFNGNYAWRFIYRLSLFNFLIIMFSVASGGKRGIAFVRNVTHCSSGRTTSLTNAWVRRLFCAPDGILARRQFTHKWLPSVSSYGHSHVTSTKKYTESMKRTSLQNEVKLCLNFKRFFLLSRLFHLS